MKEKSFEIERNKGRKKERKKGALKRNERKKERMKERKKELYLHSIELFKIELFWRLTVCKENLYLY